MINVDLRKCQATKQVQHFTGITNKCFFFCFFFNNNNNTIIKTGPE